MSMVSGRAGISPRIGDGTRDATRQISRFLNSTLTPIFHTSTVLFDLGSEARTVHSETLCSVKYSPVCQVKPNLKRFPYGHNILQKIFIMVAPTSRRSNGQTTEAELSLVHLKNCLVNLPSSLVSLLVNVNTVSASSSGMTT